MLRVIGCITTAHDLRLVALAAAVCFVVSLLGGTLFSFAVRETRESRMLWLAAAAVAAGSGFWATHFIAMLSFRSGLPVGYDPVMVLVALLVSVFGSWLALMRLSRARHLATRLIGGGGFIFAAALMHYTALFAFRTRGIVTLDPGYGVGAVGVALAIALGFGLIRRSILSRLDRTLSALILTLSICALHFTSMTGMHITPDPRVSMSPDLVQPAYLAIGVAVTLLLAVGMATLAMMIHIRTSVGALANLRDVIEAMPASLVCYDAEDRFSLWNVRFADRLANGREVSVGKPYVDSLRASVAAGLYEEAIGREEAWIADHLAARAQPFETRVQEYRRNGRWLRFEERRTHDGGLISVATDMTDLKRTSDNLAQALVRAEAADRAKNEFLANLSHELHTPLNGVVGLTDVLASTELTPPQRLVVDAILASAQSLTGLISSMLDFSELQSGDGGLKPEPFDPAQMAREASSLFAPAALAKGLALKVAIESRPGLQAVGDPGRLRQVLISLLSNAVKFTETGSVRLTLHAEETQDERRLRFAVADTGIGFDGAQADRLFARFEQGDGSMTRRFGGTGLGLAMSRRIAEMMGAELTANSLPGHGATFTLSLTLPAAPDRQAGPAIEGAASAAVEARTDAPTDQPLRVLLADDHPTNRQVVELILGAADAAMTSVENGAEAVEAFRLCRYDLVLMDLQMPVMDGLTAMKAIRDYETHAHLPRTPMIALTANVLAEHVAASLAAGADRHMGKPITAARLLDEISKVFERQTAANDVADAA